MQNNSSGVTEEDFLQSQNEEIVNKKAKKEFLKIGERLTSTIIQNGTDVQNSLRKTTDRVRIRLEPNPQRCLQLKNILS